jgi:hypothetical protein
MCFASTQMRGTQPLEEQFTALAKLLAELGSINEARIALDEIRSWAWMHASFEVAQMLAQQCMHSEAVAVAESITDKHQREDAFSAVAKTLAENGQSTKALQTAERIGHAYLRNDTFADIALALALSDNMEEASAFALLVKEPLTYSGKETLCRVLALSGRIEEAIQTALQVSSRSYDPFHDVADKRLFAVAKGLILRGALGDAIRIALEMSDEDKRIAIVDEIGVAISSAAHLAVDFAPLMKKVEEISDDRRKSICLCVLGEVMAKAGDFEQAIQAAEACTSYGRKIIATNLPRYFEEGWVLISRLVQFMRSPEALYGRAWKD